ncbi:MAG: GIY-YIG nuclease family protein [Myxococcales bacterium]|nr:GIY-YIG nuclease family protein [Myxococcales bacterium]MCB9648848.1 GIY-YIG nuclease family protein [Deltaproteobacteria bacterium]
MTGRPSAGSETEAGRWFVYLVRCADDTLYTGVAHDDVARRLAEHDAGKGAKYTRGRGPVSLLATAGPMARGDALRLELKIKRVPREEKLATLLAVAEG